MSMKKVFIFVLLFVLIGYFEGMMFNTPDSMLWYDSLNLSPLTPPDMVFPIVWTILYATLGVAMAMILESKNKFLKYLFISQMILNFLWSPVFFGMWDYYISMAILAVIVIDTIIIEMIAFKQNKKLFYLLIPYLLWTLFATHLNLYVCMNNN